LFCNDEILSEGENLSLSADTFSASNIFPWRSGWEFSCSAKMKVLPEDRCVWNEHSASGPNDACDRPLAEVPSIRLQPTDLDLGWHAGLQQHGRGLPGILAWPVAPLDVGLVSDSR
jgi:hypothetical protein